jgi:hypothetical protein
MLANSPKRREETALSWEIIGPKLKADPVITATDGCACLKKGVGSIVPSRDTEQFFININSVGLLVGTGEGSEDGGNDGSGEGAKVGATEKVGDDVG